MSILNTFYFTIRDKPSKHNIIYRLYRYINKPRFFELRLDFMIVLFLNFIGRCRRRYRNDRVVPHYYFSIIRVLFIFFKIIWKCKRKLVDKCNSFLSTSISYFDLTLKSWQSSYKIWTWRKTRFYRRRRIYLLSRQKHCSGSCRNIRQRRAFKNPLRLGKFIW